MWVEVMGVYVHYLACTYTQNIPPTQQTHHPHNHSFFIPDKAAQDGKSGNPQAGLVIDTGVCHPTYVGLIVVPACLGCLSKQPPFNRH